MVHSLEVEGATVVIRPVRNTGLIWMLVFTSLLGWTVWKFTLYDTGAWSPVNLLFPAICLFGVVAVAIHRRTRVVKLDRDQDLVLFQRRPFLVLPSRQIRYALSDFVGVGSSPEQAGEWADCVVVLVTADMRSLELLRTPHEYASSSFWSMKSKSVEPEEAAAVRNAVAKASGLRNMGFIDDLGFFKKRYRPLED